MLNYVILNYNDYETTKKCVNIIKDFQCIDKIIIVDNCSSDNSYSRLLELRSNKIDVIQTSSNGGYGYGNNYGVTYAKKTYKADYVVISNPDVIIDENSVEKCLNYICTNQDIAVVVPKMLNAKEQVCDNSVWKIPTYWQYLFCTLFLTKRITPSNNYNTEYVGGQEPVFCECVAGSWLMIDVDKFSSCGMYDENIFLYCEETVLAIKLKKMGYKTVLIPNIYFIHNHSVSINKSIKSVVKQRKIMWKSRLYVLKHYYSNTAFRRVVAYLVASISIFECGLKQLIKRLFED